MTTFLLFFIAAWIVGASIARYSEARKAAKLYKPLMEKQEIMMKAFLEDIKTITNVGLKTNKLLEDVFSESDAVPVETSRVYAAVLRNGLALRLHLLPADSVAEFHDKSQAILGPGWTADIVEYLDVFPAKEKVVVREPDKQEKKEMGLEQGLHFLMLARDRFAKAANQKKVMEAVISNYKKTYDLS